MKCAVFPSNEAAGALLWLLPHFLCLDYSLNADAASVVGVFLTVKRVKKNNALFILPGTF